MKIKAVILDLDQTLTTDTASWYQFTELLGANSKVHEEIFTRFRKGELSYAAAKLELINLWRGAHSLTRQSIQELFSQVKLRDGALEAVAYLKTKYRLCIISGAIDIFVAVMAEKLGITDFFAATRFKFDSAGQLSDFDYTLSRGEEKLGFLQQFCNKHDLERIDCAAVGDGESDRPIFDEVGLPILFIAEETAPELRESIPQQIKEWREIKKFL